MKMNFIGGGTTSIKDIELVWECPSCNKRHYEYSEPSKELIDAIENGNLESISCPYCGRNEEKEHEDDI